MQATINHQAGQQAEQPNTLTGDWVSGKRVLESKFPDEESRPCLRSLERWVRQRKIPSVKLGRLRFYSLAAVSHALEDMQRGGVAR